jgi:energy-coupling factor transporter transmembrane protein EcfT
MTTSPGELTAALERLLKPLRPLGVPYQDIAVMVALALRFLPTLLEEMQRVRDAQLSRCAGFGRGGLRRRASSAAALILPVSLGALRRAEELAVAMEARGYTHGPRTGLNELHIGHKDWAAGLITALVLAGIRGLETLGPWW